MARDDMAAVTRERSARRLNQGWAEVRERDEERQTQRVAVAKIETDDRVVERGCRDASVRDCTVVSPTQD